MTGEVVDAVRNAVGDNDCLVALGGGADSAVLLWAATEALGTDRVQAVFVYHGLEGSKMLEEAATAVAATKGVKLQVIERIISEGGNLEARARAARYESIESLLRKGTVALTGHTADDQAETVLMRLLRGSGTGAISGIPFRRGVWLRPLLGVSRASLRRTAEDLGLPFADDPANEDRRFVRARIRHVVMPVIEAECGPDVKSAIRRSASLLAADDALLESAANRIPIVSIQGGFSIPTGPLVAAPEPVASRAVRRLLRNLLDDTPGTRRDVDAVLAVARGAAAVTITGGLQVTPEPPFVTVCEIDVPEPPDGFDIRVGRTFTWHGSEYSVSKVAAAPAFIAGGRFTVLAADAVENRMSVRGLRRGDRIDIENGSTPVKEILRAAGVPRRVRPYSFIVMVDARIAALGGTRTAPWARAKRGETAIIIERDVGRGHR
ncbi:MAG: hypothetical protein BMS9Abin12_0169 [Acidimicrobiia bacterium]|nr:MAG: hypothetical protein BMS9Abin12_0169 [Acidimicrobiia bacterium]